MDTVLILLVSNAETILVMLGAWVVFRIIDTLTAY
jgi:hypothetical protein